MAYYLPSALVVITRHHPRSPLQSAKAGALQYPLNGNVYAVNFCAPIGSLPCRNGTAPQASMQLSGLNGVCYQALGAFSSLTTKLLSTDPGAGITLTYGGGAVCNSNSRLNYSTVIKLACDPSLPSSPPNDLDVDALSGPTGDCEYVYEMRSSYGCPYSRVRVVPSLGGGWIAFIAVLVSCVMYCLIGAGVKRWRFGSTGVEAIPHIDTARKVKERLVGLVGRGGGGGGDEYFAVDVDGAEQPIE